MNSPFKILLISLQISYKNLELAVVQEKTKCCFFQRRKLKNRLLMLNSFLELCTNIFMKHLFLFCNNLFLLNLSFNLNNYFWNKKRKKMLLKDYGRVIANCFLCYCWFSMGVRGIFLWMVMVM